MTHTHDDPEPRPSAPPAHARTRRVPPWVLAVAGVVVIAVVGGVVALLATNRADTPPPEDVVVTLPAPTPTVEPVERPAGTPFADSLPPTVLQYALAEQGPHSPLLLDGALEGYRLVFTDGAGTDLVVLAGQWRDAAAATQAFDARRAEVEAAAAAAAETAAPEPSDGATAGEGSEGSEGTVEVDGTEVGAYVIVPLPDGTGTALWRNGTVVVEVVGPADALPAFFAAFPL